LKVVEDFWKIHSKIMSVWAEARFGSAVTKPNLAQQIQIRVNNCCCETLVFFKFSGDILRLFDLGHQEAQCECRLLGAVVNPLKQMNLLVCLFSDDPLVPASSNREGSGWQILRARYLYISNKKLLGIDLAEIDLEEDSFLGHNDHGGRQFVGGGYRQLDQHWCNDQQWTTWEDFEKFDSFQISPHRRCLSSEFVPECDKLTELFVRKKFSKTIWKKCLVRGFAAKWMKHEIVIKGLDKKILKVTPKPFMMLTIIRRNEIEKSRR